MRGSFQGTLLDYYQRELSFLREIGAAFARNYPKIASRLQIGHDESPDPHVERLIESFAFLTGRVQLGIDSEFPLIPTALLGILYPHLLEPVPSMVVARIEADPTQGELTSGFLIPRHTALFTETEQGETCRFRTGTDVTLWPLAVTEAAIESADQYDFLDDTDIATVLRIRVAAQGGATLADMGVERLQFYINADLERAGSVYEILFSNVADVVVLPDYAGPPRALSGDALRPVGFAADEALLPHPGQAHPAYRLVQEYFAFPEKYLFFDVAELSGHGAEAGLDILFLLKQTPDRRLTVTADTFLLGCTPVINLFPRTSEPIRLDHTQTEYRLIPDSRWERITEIHSIERVSASADARDEALAYAPFFSFDHATEGNGSTAFWYANRHNTERADLPGTYMTLSFVDLEFRPAMPADQTVYAHTLCTNRGLADQVPPGALLQMEEAAPVARISCLRKPTGQIHAPLGGPALWRLISHLSVNHLSLAGGPDSLEALREILRLYTLSTHPATEQQIRGIRSLEARPVVRRRGTDAWRGFVRGTEVTMTLDERFFVGGSAFLLGAVLSRFFALYASINSFSQLVVRNAQREGIWKQWPPVGGEQAVL